MACARRWPSRSRTARARKNGKRAEALAQTALADLRSASDAIRDRVLNRDSKRSEAAKKAARTRKRNAAKRSASAKKAAATRKSAKKRGRSSLAGPPPAANQVRVSFLYVMRCGRSASSPSSARRCSS